MIKCFIWTLILLVTKTKIHAQSSIEKRLFDSSVIYIADEHYKQFIATSDFLDASINSINSFTSLIKKENYRIKITSFNNPTNSEMGFNLENEIQTALKPLLSKAKSTNTNKFSEVVTSLISGQSKTINPVKR